ncbi:phosphatidylglycerol lysyltransferase domain-containing protein [Oscillospiraceae bacterium 50-16]
MLDFQPLTLEQLPQLRPFFGYSGSRICDTTPGTVFIWRDMYQTEWAVYDGSLYFKVDYPGLGPTFTLPLGGGRLEHFSQIAAYCCRRNMPISFYPVPKDELPRLQEFFPNSAAVAERDSFDYLYRAEDLKFFRGKKLGGQRNHVNKFLKTYGNWLFRPVTPEDIPELKRFLDRYTSRWDKGAATFHEDISKTHEVLDNFRAYDLLGGMLLVDGSIVGFSLGEVIGDTLFVHIEKADRDYEGCYQMLVAQYAQQFAGEGVSFLNREDDTGDPGLRTSKLSYHPVALLEKYTVTVEEPCAAGQGH